MLEYRGYRALVEFDEGEGIYRGVLTDVPDHITFRGETIQLLTHEMVTAVNDYIDFCMEWGREPNEYTGEYVVKVL